ncbi:formate dehydrogenase accessory protein FdhE [Vogesella fluminis]|uniref:Protein FdhE n=1 Tax=Vogesella fluminis TaxID=1069161 RepID=A0ABQ3H7N7_9NEIS|nr:formate dehydrogenase accessory protein FdhE [Vogesella fluminis]GHD74740.1 protein FdhE [Vogesella fluminis]
MTQFIDTAAHAATPALRLATLTVFSRRAERLQTLAANHPLRDFLLFCAALARAQHACLATRVEHAVADSASLRQLLTLLRRHLDVELPPDSHSALLCLLVLDDAALQALADALRHGRYDAHSPLAAAWPLLGAALQVQATIVVRQQDVAALPAGETACCPACGGLPVASVLRRGDSGHAVRHVCCSLCASEWHVSRVKCVACGNTRQLQYHSLADRDAAAPQPDRKQPHAHRGTQELECCDSCHGALKVVSRLQDANADAFADDVASLTLDLLAGDAGYGRIGFNPCFLPARD